MVQWDPDRSGGMLVNERRMYRDFEVLLPHSRAEPLREYFGDLSGLPVSLSCS